MRNEEIHTL